MSVLRCIGCEKQFADDRVRYTCDQCRSTLEVLVDPERLGRIWQLEGRGVWRYAPLLPVEPTQAISIGEGDTGLHRCDRLAKKLRLEQFWVKNEGENPTGSFKDRGMTVGISKALEVGAKAVACASTGNTAASMAAYAAKAGIPAIVLVPKGKVAIGKIAQAVVHGARIVQIDGNFDAAMRLVHEFSLAKQKIYLLNSINPFRLEGQKTLAYEICEQLGDAPDIVVLPMGNAGNISALWKGFKEFHAGGRLRRLPQMIGIQAKGAAPIVKAFTKGSEECVEKNPETIATAIRIGAPVNWKKAIGALRDSYGQVGVVGDAEILQAQRMLAELEGLFVEPASAVPIAYLKKNRPNPVLRVVCVATGHGLKDPDAVMGAKFRIEQAKPTLASLERVLAL